MEQMAANHVPFCAVRRSENKIVNGLVPDERNFWIYLLLSTSIVMGGGKIKS